MKQIVSLKIDISRKYPNMFDFIVKMISDKNKRSVDELLEK